jgi:hypothetical protein
MDPSLISQLVILGLFFCFGIILLVALLISPKEKKEKEPKQHYHRSLRCEKKRKNSSPPCCLTTVDGDASPGTDTKQFNSEPMFVQSKTYI